MISPSIDKAVSLPTTPARIRRLGVYDIPRPAAQDERKASDGERLPVVPMGNLGDTIGAGSAKHG